MCNWSAPKETLSHSCARSNCWIMGSEGLSSPLCEANSSLLPPAQASGIRCSHIAGHPCTVSRLPAVPLPAWPYPSPCPRSPPPPSSMLSSPDGPRHCLPIPPTPSSLQKAPLASTPTSCCSDKFAPKVPSVGSGAILGQGRVYIVSVSPATGQVASLIAQVSGSTPAPCTG